MIKDWQSAGLLKASVIKPVITTVEQSLVIRRLGHLQKETQEELRRAIGKIVG